MPYIFQNVLCNNTALSHHESPMRKELVYPLDTPPGQDWVHFRRFRVAEIVAHLLSFQLHYATARNTLLSTRQKTKIVSEHYFKNKCRKSRNHKT